MDEIITWLDHKGSPKLHELKRFRSKQTKTTLVSRNYASNTNRPSNKPQKSNIYSKWKTTKGSPFSKKKTCKSPNLTSIVNSQKSLTPTLNKMGKWPKQNPFYSPE